MTARDEARLAGKSVRTVFRHRERELEGRPVLAPHRPRAQGPEAYREARRALGWDPGKLQKTLGVGRSTVYRYELKYRQEGGDDKCQEG